jgi:folate-dependent tRNA-U54 methylase TrmFO/GidA
LRIEQENFQPSNVVWSMVDAPPRARHEAKRAHREAVSKKALDDLEAWKSKLA